MTTKGIYNTLVTQLDKLARHNRQGSFRTKDRYYEAVKRFCAYLAAHYHLQKLENVSGKHLVSYVLYLQAQGKSASTIKTDLSAIRFFHDKMSHPRSEMIDCRRRKALVLCVFRGLPVCLSLFTCTRSVRCGMEVFDLCSCEQPRTPGR